MRVLQHSSVLLVGLCLTGCQAIADTPVSDPAIERPTDSPSITSTVTEVAGIPAEIETPNTSPQLIQGGTLEPVLQARLVRLDSGSPDSHFLAVWTSPLDQNGDGSYPLGELHFIDLRNNEVCRFPETYAFAGHPAAQWQSDGTVTIRSLTPPQVGHPCQGDFESDPGSIETPQPTVTAPLSPSGKYQVQTRLVDATEYAAETQIVDLETTRAVIAVRWQYWDAIGDGDAHGQWIDDRQFLLSTTVDRGPLLLTTSGEVIEVGPSLFGVSANCGSGCRYQATAIHSSDVGDSFLVLFMTGEMPLDLDVRLRDLRTGVIRVIPDSAFGGVSPDGTRVVTYQTKTVTAFSEEYRLSLHDAGSAFLGTSFEVVTDKNPFPLTWAPESNRIVVLGISDIQLVSLQPVLGVLKWNLGDFEPTASWFSPDGSTLAVTAQHGPANQDEAVFVMPAVWPSPT